MFLIRFECSLYGIPSNIQYKNVYIIKHSFIYYFFTCNNKGGTKKIYENHFSIQFAQFMRVNEDYIEGLVGLSHLMI